MAGTKILDAEIERTSLTGNEGVGMQTPGSTKSEVTLWSTVKSFVLENIIGGGNAGKYIKVNSIGNGLEATSGETYTSGSTGVTVTPTGALRGVTSSSLNGQTFSQVIDKMLINLTPYPIDPDLTGATTIVRDAIPLNRRYSGMISWSDDLQKSYVLATTAAQVAIDLANNNLANSNTYWKFIYKEGDTVSVGSNVSQVRSPNTTLLIDATDASGGELGLPVIAQDLTATEILVRSSGSKIKRIPTSTYALAVNNTGTNTGDQTSSTIFNMSNDTTPDWDNIPIGVYVKSFNLDSGTKANQPSTYSTSGDRIIVKHYVRTASPSASIQEATITESTSDSTKKNKTSTRIKDASGIWSSWVDLNETGTSINAKLYNIVVGTNFNNFITDGKYKIPDATTFTNEPVSAFPGSYGVILEVSVLDTSNIVQKANAILPGSTSGVFYRVYDNGTWRTWSQF